MNRQTFIRRSLGVAGTLMAITVAAAGPASAHNGVDHTTPPQPGAYTSMAQAVEASLHDIPVGPLTVANWPSGPTHAVLTGSQHVLDFGVLESNANGSYDDGWVSADSSVAHIGGGIDGILKVDVGTVTSQCRSDVNGQTGSASIAGGKLSVLGYGVLDLPLNPAPNTKVSIPGLLDVTLNQQVHNADGSLTVTAIDIHGTSLLQTLLLSQHPLYLTVAQSTCDKVEQPTHEVPAATPYGMATAGAGVLAAAGGAFFVIRRRRTAADLAA